MTERDFLKSARRGRIGGGIDHTEFAPEAVLKSKRPLALCATLGELAPRAQAEWRAHVESGDVGYLEASDAVGTHGIFFAPGNEANARALADALGAGNDVLVGLLLGYTPDDVNRYVFHNGGYPEALRQWAEAKSALGRGLRTD